ncbi:MAG: thioesterase family protein [Pseudomonadota bacterium]
MYPFIRAAAALMRAKGQPKLGALEPLETTHFCMPWDLDFFLELNNGQTLTLYELNRFQLAVRTGLLSAMRRNSWGLTVAGSTIQYRRRVRIFERMKMRVQVVFWDAKFIYMEQSIHVRDVLSSHLLIRTAVTDRNGIVPVETLMQAMATDVPPLEAPDWVASWIEADAERPIARKRTNPEKK